MVGEALLSVDDTAEVDADLLISDGFGFGPLGNDHREGGRSHQVAVAQSPRSLEIGVCPVVVLHRGGKLPDRLTADLVVDARIGMALTGGVDGHRHHSLSAAAAAAPGPGLVVVCVFSAAENLGGLAPAQSDADQVTEQADADQDQSHSTQG